MLRSVCCSAGRRGRSGLGLILWAGAAFCAQQWKPLEAVFGTLKRGDPTSKGGVAAPARLAGSATCGGCTHRECRAASSSPGSVLRRGGGADLAFRAAARVRAEGFLSDAGGLVAIMPEEETENLGVVRNQSRRSLLSVDE